MVELTFGIQLTAEDFDGLMDDVLEEIAQKVFQKSQEKVVEMKAVDTGFMLKTAFFESKFMQKKISYPAPYAAWVEYGRHEGTMPPVEPIAMWVKRQVGVRNEKEALRIAWAVAMNMKEKGIKPRPFIRTAVREVLGVND